MSNAAINPSGATALAPDLHNPHAGNGHDPHLAHHFDTPEQQYSSAKLGMWVFLGTEILMFGGLFCAYSVYRHNHPEVFEFSEQYLDRLLGAINTLVLITSSLTMAWAVRSAQLGHQKSLRWLMAVTIIGGYVFLGIKSVEYRQKWEHVLFIGPHDQFIADYKGVNVIELEEKEHAAATALPPIPPAKPMANSLDNVSLIPPDPNADTPDAAKIRPSFAGPTAPVILPTKGEVELSDLQKTGEDKHVYTFFAIYFFMTGLHGVHVVIGMSLIAWVLFRASGRRAGAWLLPMYLASLGLFLAVLGIIIYNPHLPRGQPTGIAWLVLVAIGCAIVAISVLWAMWRVSRRRLASEEGEFGPTYFTPVDLSGLYWHLVDLIWIFLFPMLYLIH
ncbi:MAG TPA: hypothetical protein VFC78_05825 [Tepidisphaeraceae bacterium]|nr:hypothetical protein [Tepidisphaeraceae bacterium]